MKLFINHLSYVCIHNAYILPEGFEGDALILDYSHPRSSALEQSSRSICLCHWTMGTRGCYLFTLLSVYRADEYIF